MNGVAANEIALQLDQNLVDLDQLEFVYERARCPKLSGCIYIRFFSFFFFFLFIIIIIIFFLLAACMCERNYIYIGWVKK